MKENEKCKQRLRADIALIEAQLIRFKVRGMGFTSEAKDRHDEHVEQLELKIDGINERLSHFEKADGPLTPGSNCELVSWMPGIPCRTLWRILFPFLKGALS